MTKCQHFPLCGGCTFEPSSSSNEEAKKKDNFWETLQTSGVNGQIGEYVCSPLFSRRRATLTGKRTKRGAILGFLEAKSHNIVDIHTCLVTDSEILALRPRIIEMIPILGSRSSQVKFHITKLHYGFDLTIENAKKIEAPQMEIIAQIARRTNIQRVLINGEQVFFAGSAQIEIGNMLIDVPPHPFLQATKDAEIKLRNMAHAAVQGLKKVADLFSGLGTFSYGLEMEVDAFEGNAEMNRAMEDNIHSLGLHNIKATKRDLFREPLSSMELSVFGAVIIDPPRAGAKTQCHELAGSEVSKIAYISCDPSSFARDARILIDGGYQMGAITLIDQFRFSDHIESFTVFEKLR